MLDFSNCSTKSKYYDETNKLVAGKMKDGVGGSAIEEFVGLKSSIYPFFDIWQASIKRKRVSMKMLLRP